MSNPTAPFNETYGTKPVFGGVYTTAPVETMCKEVELFLKNGIHVYVEPLRFRNDSTFFRADQKAIKDVLNIMSKNISSARETSTPKIGINFLFKPKESYSLAEQYGLSFVINDAFRGNYLHRDGFCDNNNTLSNANAPIVPSIHLFAGITPGYLVNQTPYNHWADEMETLGETADVVLIGNSPYQTVLEQLMALKQSHLVDKPLIAAQGVSAETITAFLKYADGALIGSGFRDKGAVSLERIKEIKELQRRAIES